MRSFKIGTTEFGVGKVVLSTENNLLNLEISGSGDMFDQLTEADDSEWGWALYAPKIYFEDVPFKGNTLTIDNETLNQCNIALYMMEHNDFTGTIELTEDVIHIQGEVYLMDSILPVFIEINRHEL
jgi:hypothetical protein